MTTNSRDIAAAIVFKLHKHARQLEAKDALTDSERRHLLALKTLALVGTDRIRLDRAKKLNSRG